MSKPSDKQKAGKTIQHKAADYDKVLSGVMDLLDAARRASARVVNSLMTATYWEIGRRIVEHEQGGEKRAGYGEELIEGLSSDLTQKYGRGFGVIQLRTMRQFYLFNSTGHPYRSYGSNIFQSANTRHSAEEGTPCGDRQSSLEGDASTMLPSNHTIFRAALARALAVIVVGCSSTPRAQRERELPDVKLRDASLLQFRGANSSSPDKPGECDCNNPAHWDGGTLYVFNSAGHPWRSAGPDLFHLQTNYVRCEYDNKASGGRWIECTWKVEDGTLYGWYHFEPTGICPGAHPDSPKMNLTAPKIGAVKSSDNGATWHDLGVVLEAPPGTLKCDTKNYYFAGGNGDFSVMLDARKQFLYFFFSNYPKDVPEQGVAVARIRWADRDRPVGKVWKWRDGQWHEPGIGGHVTPIFQVKTDWNRADADAFWGPSVHWNTHLRQYVILLNRAKDGKFTPEGIYVTFNRDLGNPSGWSPPQKIPVAEDKLAWYPQVMGLDKSRHETDKLAGRVARFFIRGQSRWEILFLKPGEQE